MFLRSAELCAMCAPVLLLGAAGGEPAARWDGADAGSAGAAPADGPSADRDESPS